MTGRSKKGGTWCQDDRFDGLAFWLHCIEKKPQEVCWYLVPLESMLSKKSGRCAECDKRKSRVGFLCFLLQIIWMRSVLYSVDQIIVGCNLLDFLLFALLLYVASSFSMKRDGLSFYSKKGQIKAYLKSKGNLEKRGESLTYVST